MSRAACKRVRRTGVRRGAFVTLVAILASAAALEFATAAHAEGVTLAESGSTLIYPLFKVWIAAYQKNHPGVQLTAAATGSSAGVAAVIAGRAQIGVSDAYLSDVEIRNNGQLIDVPLAIAAQTVNYNVPGLNGAHLKFDGPTLAAIYAGMIRNWDAPAIAALNPGVSLPHQPIVAVHRSEGAGDTFIFSQFLSFSTPSWERDTGYGTTVAWPSVPSAVAAAGNTGMLRAIQSTPDSIGYIGISFAADVSAAKLGTAALKNAAGEFVLPTRDTITTGAASLGSRTPPDERLSLVFAPASGAYPLVNYEYAVVSTRQSDAVTAAALRQFLSWAIVPSETKARYLDAVQFIPLPPHTWELSQTQIQSIR